MQTVSLFAFVALTWWGLASAVRAASVVATFVQPPLRRRAATRTDRPPVSIIVPVRNVEPELEEAFVSVFRQSYPGLEVLVAAAENDSPAIDIARRAAARFPHIATRFILGNKRFTLNPKVSNLAPAIAAAEYELILIKDANVWLADGQLDDFVRNLTPGTGMVCAIPIAVNPETISADIECAILNGHAAPWLMAASVFRLNIGFGKVMLFNRRDFERVDGIAAMAPTFGDDHALSKALARIGLRTVFSASVIRQTLGRRTLREVWDRQLRWMTIRRVEEPLAFYVEPFFSCGFSTLAAAVAAPLLGMPWWWLAAATLLLWLASDTLVVAYRRWGWSWRFPLAGICREPLVVALWLRTLTVRGVRWGGQHFDLPRPAR